MDQVAEAQVAHLLPQEIAGAYKALCTMIMIQTAVAFRCKVRRKEDAQARRSAREWMDGGGIITFADCCTALDVSEDEARAGFQRIVDGAMDASISRVSGGM